jgi:hypothetical protein
VESRRKHKKFIEEYEAKNRIENVTAVQGVAERKKRRS